MPQWPPRLQTVQDVPTMFNADSADQNAIVGRVTRPGVVSQVEFIPAWNAQGAITNNRTYTLYNRKSGAGTTAIATLVLTAAVSLSKGVGTTMTLNTSGGLRAVAIGDILQWESLHAAAGMPDPGGIVIINQSFTP